MNPRHLESAAEFCELVDKPDLLTYLGLEPGCTAAEARKALKARRRKMQGMQANPKFRDQARALIKHVQAFDEILAEPTAYLADVMRRREEAQIPVLRMSVEGVLKGGMLTQEQEDFLRNQAIDLGISEESFERLLNDMTVASGVKRPSTGTPLPERRVAPLAQSAPPVPPAFGSSPPGYTGEFPTIKPAAEKSVRLYIKGKSNREVTVKSGIVYEQLEVRNLGDSAWSGSIQSDREWLTPSPSRLDRSKNRQDIKIQIDSSKLPAGSDSATVTVSDDSGTRIKVTYVVTKTGSSMPLIVAGAAGVAVLLLMLIGVAVFAMGGSGSGVLPTKDLVIRVDPKAQKIIVDGVLVGHGSETTLPRPDKERIALHVEHPNFNDYQQTVAIEPGQDVEVRLDLKSPMNFSPNPATMVHAELGQRAGDKVPVEALNKCIEQIAGEAAITGTIRIHIAENGWAAGVEIDGVDDKSARDCLTRHAATVLYPPLQDGDYATVKYSFESP